MKWAEWAGMAGGADGPPLEVPDDPLLIPQSASWVHPSIRRSDPSMLNLVRRFGSQESLPSQAFLICLSIWPRRHVFLGPGPDDMPLARRM